MKIVSDVISRQAFYHLFTRQVNGREIDNDLFSSLSDRDWRGVITFAHKQGLVGLCLDSLESLPEYCRPPKELLLNLIGITTQLEYHYKTHLTTLQSLSDFYHKHGIRTILLKGYGLSLNYPKPNHRPSGDIDLFLSDGEQGDELIKELGIEVKQNEEKHSTFIYHGVHVENHATVVCELEHGSLSEIETFLEQELKEHSKYDNVSGCYLPSGMFNAVFLPLHLGGHLVYGGANLRQILDYGLMVKNSAEDSINWNKVRELAVKGGFFRFISCLNGICIDYLGLPQDCFPNWTRDAELEKKVIEDIINSSYDNTGSFAGKIRRYFENRWKYNLVYGRESHFLGLFRRTRSWMIWKWGIGRKSLWEK